VQIIDSIETYRDALSSMLDLHLSNISYRLNEVMKVLTIISTIFIPLTFIAGVYGMNFHFMPELNWKLGYPVFWILIFVVSGVMVYYFKKKRWF
jgi:magnesium transporter